MSDSGLQPLPIPSPEVIREFNDRGAQWLLEDPENVRGLIEIIEPALAGSFDFERAERINRTFIPANLQKEESDLIFRVPFVGTRDPGHAEVLVYLLIEHQSRPDLMMAIRLLSYMLQIWNLVRREWEDRNLPAEQRRLPLVIPVVLYTGEENWNTPIRLADIMDAAPELDRFIPGWETLILYLHDLSAEVLTQFGTAIGQALRFWQAEQTPIDELRRILNETLEGLENLSEERRGQYWRVMQFCWLLSYHRRSEPDYAVLLTRIREQSRRTKFHIREEFDRMTLTMAQVAEQRAFERAYERAREQVAAEVEARVRAETEERIRAEAEARVHAEEEARRANEQIGVLQEEARTTEQALREALQAVLTARFGELSAEIVAAIRAANAETLNSWIHAATTAETLEKVGITS